MNCPCNPKQRYELCCQPFHQGKSFPDTAEQLMRSRYSAFVLGEIDYIIETTIPAQQQFLNKQEITEWSRQTQWHKLQINNHTPNIGKRHASVDFEAFFITDDGMQSHREHSTFVTIENRWYFIDPVRTGVTNKQPCICGSGEKFKHCCGKYFP